MKEKLKKWYEENQFNVNASFVMAMSVLFGMIIGSNIGEFVGYRKGLVDGVDVTVTAVDITTKN